MTTPEPKACTACDKCTFVCGAYLCTLPPECFDLRDPDTDDRIEITGEWVGMDCDRARKQGEFCGPDAKAWEPAGA